MAASDRAVPAAKRAQEIVAELKRLSSKKARDGMARYAIPSDHAFGVPMSTMQQVARRAGHDQELAEALWKTGWYEARTVAAFVAEPEKLTPAQMDRWCRDFDNWAICDTVCFKLFDRSPHALKKIAQWAGKRDEYQRRAAFALLASVALHDRESGDEPFLRLLPVVEKAASDERNFVKKGVSWALRSVGTRSAKLNAASVALSRRLAESDNASARWIGKGAVRELTGPIVRKRLEAKSRAQKRG
ncbi:MAG: DNA alkylation repair protein [Candidatus Eiseniibacteriota bacterium]